MCVWRAATTDNVSTAVLGFECLSMRAPYELEWAYSYRTPFAFPKHSRDMRSLELAIPSAFKEWVGQIEEALKNRRSTLFSPSKEKFRLFKAQYMSNQSIQQSGLKLSLRQRQEGDFFRLCMKMPITSSQNDESSFKERIELEVQVERLFDLQNKADEELCRQHFIHLLEEHQSRLERPEHLMAFFQEPLFLLGTLSFWRWMEPVEIEGDLFYFSLDWGWAQVGKQIEPIHCLELEWMADSENQPDRIALEQKQAEICRSLESICDLQPSRESKAAMIARLQGKTL